MAKKFSSSKTYNPAGYRHVQASGNHKKRYFGGGRAENPGQVARDEAELARTAAALRTAQGVVGSPFKRVYTSPYQSPIIEDQKRGKLRYLEGDERALDEAGPKQGFQRMVPYVPTQPKREGPLYNRGGKVKYHGG